jgi:creatinine amidohydrolase
MASAFYVRFSMECELQKLSWIKVKNLVPEKINTVLFPVGTVEAHGSAALGTDNYIPEAIAHSQAERLNALIAPTLNYGITRSLYRYPGSFTIQPRNFVPFLTDILNSLADHGFKNIILLNGHGGNNSALKEAAYDLHCRSRVNVAAVHWWNVVGDITREHFGQAGGHAGLDETAAVQAIDPALVDKDEYDEKMAYLVSGGADVYPIPGSVMLYTKGEGYPNFDQAQADAYLPKVAEAVGDFIKSIIDQWNWIDI